jgi:hypothetical protein
LNPDLTAHPIDQPGKLSQGRTVEAAPYRESVTDARLRRSIRAIMCAIMCAMIELTNIYILGVAGPGLRSLIFSINATGDFLWFRLLGIAS